MKFLYDYRSASIIAIIILGADGLADIILHCHSFFSFILQKDSPGYIAQTPSGIPL